MSPDGAGRVRHDTVARGRDNDSHVPSPKIRSITLKTRGPRSISISGLSPVQDVERDEKFYRALSESPWLRIDISAPVQAGSWIELRYATGFFDPLARPLLRCFLQNSFHDEILPGALFGRAIWIGFIPHGTKEIWISPTNQAGPFSFTVESCVALTHARAIWRALRKNIGHCLLGMGAQLIGLRHFAAVELKRALSITPFADYDRWRKDRMRELDLLHLDAPRTDWDRGPHIKFVAYQDDRSSEHAARLLSELLSQPYPNWSIVIVTAALNIELPEPRNGATNERLSKCPPDAPVSQLCEGLSEHDFIVPFDISDSHPAYALCVLAEASGRDTKTDIFYGDEEFINDAGQYSAPRLRPDWSSAIGPGAMGTAKFFRAGFLKKLPPFSIEMLRPAQEITTGQPSQNAVVTHIRRVMRTRRSKPPVAVHSPNVRAGKNMRARPELVSGPRATLIIPTKDRFDLLRRCVASLEKMTCLSEIEIIIVDNGTVQRDARHLLDRLAQRQPFRVISRPGPFNFARFCNDAAAEALAPVLIFLNNDTEVINEQWLNPLLDWAQQDEVGAVGAKLLYPNGCVQHAGVVLGLGGRAGHFERLLGTDDPGYLDRLRTPHEVSSVTAACLAVEKRKFDAMGGFDAINLPIELNDIDLCLRLSERGWKTALVPDSVLIHRESASRGIVLHPDKTYGKEHQYFRSRWIHRLRDDPFFHPGLSLHAHHPALD